MKKSKLFLAAMLAGFSSVSIAQAQTARLEIIHNSPDPAAASVDVYVDGIGLLVDNFEYRTTTGFITVPSGVSLAIGLAPSTSNEPGGNGAGDIIATLNEGPLASGETYIAIAKGFLDGTGFSPAPAFGLDIFGGAQEAAAGGAGSNDVLVYHGATDAPMVDVDELVQTGGAEVVSDLSYGEFTSSYLALGVANYTLQVQAASSGAAVAAYYAALENLGVDGAALTVIASGFLAPGAGGLNNGPAFGLFVSTGAEGPLLALAAPTARVEIIHNAADTLLDVVDVFVNGDEAVPDFAFRTSTGFIDLPAGMPLDINAAPDGAGFGGSVDLAEIPFLFPDSTYIAIANGTASPGYAPQQTLGLDIFVGAREAGVDPTETDLLVYHGATDAPAVDVEVVSDPFVELVNGAAYSQFAGYLTVPTLNYTLQIQADANDAAVAAFDAPLAGLTAQGAALTVLASGFLDVATNEGPAFGLYASTGAAGPLTMLPMSMARLEVIHNAADAAAAVVDVFVNGTELIPDFAFRTTTGFIDVPAGMPLSIEVAPDGAGLAGALPSIDIPYLASGETYIAIANGIVSATGYTPSAMDAPFGLDVYAEAREAATSSATNTDVLVYHGSTDAPTVDVSETGLGAGLIVDDISYGEFNADGYLELGTQNYQLTIQDETGAVNVATFDAPLETLMTEGAALTVLASGFFAPENNSNGAGFGLWVSLGASGDLIPLSNVTGIEDVEVISNAGLFPNPTNDNATMFFDLVDDTNINLEVINTMGQRVVVKSFGEMLSGNHRVEIPASELAPGFYFVNLRTNNGVVSTKLQVLR